MADLDLLNSKIPAISRNQGSCAVLHVLSVENANRGKCQPMHPSLAYGGMYSNTTEWEIIGKIRILCERVYLSPSPVASNYVPTANDEVFVLSKKNRSELPRTTRSGLGHATFCHRRFGKQLNESRAGAGDPGSSSCAGIVPGPCLNPSIIYTRGPSLGVLEG